MILFGPSLIEIQSRPNQDFGTLYIANGVLVENRRLYYRLCCMMGVPFNSINN